MAADVLCGRCGALLTNPNAPCPRCGSPASGAYYQPATAQGKNPWTAAALAIIPGCGHFYLGHNLKGVGFIVGIVGFQLFDLGLDATVKSKADRHETEDRPTNGKRTNQSSESSHGFSTKIASASVTRSTT